MKLTGLIAAGLLLVPLTACVDAPSAADLEIKAKAATARALGDTLSLDAVTVSGLTRGAVRAEWRASAAGVDYACNADERFSHPDCQLIGS